MSRKTSFWCRREPRSVTFCSSAPRAASSVCVDQSSIANEPGLPARSRDGLVLREQPAIRFAERPGDLAAVRRGEDIGPPVGLVEVGVEPRVRARGVEIAEVPGDAFGAGLRRVWHAGEYKGKNRPGEGGAARTPAALRSGRSPGSAPG